MKGLDLSRVVLTMGVAAALIAGCGEAQPPIGAPGAIPQKRGITNHAEHSGSWMLPEAKSEDLLYVSSRVTSQCTQDCGVHIYSFPAGKNVGLLLGFHSLQRLCSDAKGNVWITDDVGGSRVGPGRLIEYPHAGTKPISTLTESDPPTACSVETSTGNLAVVNSGTYSDVLAVFRGGRGKPTFYTGASTVPSAVSYDNNGDIFMADSVSTYSDGVDWLPAGASKIRYLPTKPRAYPNGGVLWFGKYLTANAREGHIARYVIDNKSAKEVSRTQLYGVGGPFIQYWIAGKWAMATDRAWIQMWEYPAGGNPVRTIELSGAFGVTVSIAPIH